VGHGRPHPVRAPTNSKPTLANRRPRPSSSDGVPGIQSDRMNIRSPHARPMAALTPHEPQPAGNPRWPTAAPAPVTVMGHRESIAIRMKIKSPYTRAMAALTPHEPQLAGNPLWPPTMGCRESKKIWMSEPPRTGHGRNIPSSSPWCEGSSGTTKRPTCQNAAPEYGTESSAGTQTNDTHAKREDRMTDWILQCLPGPGCRPGQSLQVDGALTHPATDGPACHLRGGPH
jgi:hypothetical protein